MWPRSAGAQFRVAEISKALSNDALEQFVSADRIIDAKC